MALQAWICLGYVWDGYIFIYAVGVVTVNTIIVSTLNVLVVVVVVATTAVVVVEEFFYLPYITQVIHLFPTPINYNKFGIFIYIVLKHHSLMFH